MDVGTVVTIAGGTVGFLGVIGGVLIQAFLNPIQSKTEANKATSKDHEYRLRSLETTVNTHGTQMDNILVSIDRLIDRIDLLVSRDYERNINK